MLYRPIVSFTSAICSPQVMLNPLVDALSASLTGPTWQPHAVLPLWIALQVRRVGGRRVGFRRVVVAPA